MEYTVQLSEQAKEDLFAIYIYIRNVLKSRINADAFLGRMFSEIEKLNTMPSSYHLYPTEPWHSRGIHYFSVNDYSIFYHINEDIHIVTVIHIIYGKRDLEKILD